MRVHLRDPGLLCLFGIGFLMMGAFVTVYNYLGFRLLAAPFDLPAQLVGLIFLGYIAGPGPRRRPAASATGSGAAR